MSDKKTSVKRLIAVCGKGGVGKTAFTAMAARALLEGGRAGKLLLIDADPAMGLPHALGVKVARTMGHVREEIIQRARNKGGEDSAQLAHMVDYLALEALQEREGFALLAMGRTETLGCFCPVNSLLRGTIAVLSSGFDTILIDGEAGLEQLNRQVMQGVDTLLAVSDPTSRGLQTVSLIRNMVERDQVIRCGKLGLVFNRVQGDRELLERLAAEVGMPVFGFVPLDENIARHDLVGKPLTELPPGSPALEAVRDLVEQYLLR